METKLINRFPAGEIKPPPSKSYSHRAAICAALALLCSGESGRIGNLGNSDDIRATLAAMKTFGVCAETDGDSTVFRRREKTNGPMDCGESGSTLRFLIPLSAVLTGDAVFTCGARLSERPLGEFETVFAASGVLFTRTGRETRVSGRLNSGIYKLRGDISSQYISGLLMALPLADGDSEIHVTTGLESRPYVDMTLQTMKEFGVEIKDAGNVFYVKGGQKYRPADYTVEADYSQAAFFLAASALGRDVVCKGLNPVSLQGDRVILDIVSQMGAEIVTNGNTVRVKAEGLNAVTVDVSACPDLVPVLAVLFSLARGTSRIINAARLRLKESDRLRSMTLELQKLGADVTESGDSMTVRGRERLRGGVTVDAHNDHRVAMALAVAGIRCEQPVRLTGWDSVRKSYPSFWNDFENLL